MPCPADLTTCAGDGGSRCSMRSLNCLGLLSQTLDRDRSSFSVLAAAVARSTASSAPRWVRREIGRFDTSPIRGGNGALEQSQDSRGASENVCARKGHFAVETQEMPSLQG